MTGWTCIIPLNLGRDCKTRLADRLTREQRDRLVDVMACHVVDRVRAAARIDRIVILSPAQPAFERVDWVQDRGRGLNAELRAAWLAQPTLVIHADLPLLQTDDVDLLLDKAQQVGAAIAPDSTGTGTNALALTRMDASFVPEFGPGSFARHRTRLPQAAIVARPGLALDIDRPDDLDLALSSEAVPIARSISAAIGALRLTGF